jgi:chloramphenicol O-acetyltransferase type A
MIEISIIERVRMNKKIISIQDTNRKEHFLYFKNIGYPYVGLTVNLDITHFLQNLKASGNPFYLSFLYRVVNAANAIPEFRRRIENDGIVEYDYCKASNVILKMTIPLRTARLTAANRSLFFLPKGEKALKEQRTKGIFKRTMTLNHFSLFPAFPGYPIHRLRRLFHFRQTVIQDLPGVNICNKITKR